MNKRIKKKKLKQAMKIEHDAELFVEKLFNEIAGKLQSSYGKFIRENYDPITKKMRPESKSHNLIYGREKEL